MTRRVSRTGVELVRRWEGLRLEAYQCSAHRWTIGFGHTKGVEQGDRISRAEAERMLTEDLAIFARGVSSSVKAPLSQNQFDALVSLAFNIGVAAFSGSTLVAKLNRTPPDYDGASNEFARWRNVDGKPDKGLERRRLDERALFLRPDEPPRVA